MLSDRLKELREDLELNQEDVAKRINVGRSTYASWEVGRAEPSVSILKDIAKFYNVSIDYLCENTDIKEAYYNDHRLCNYINKCIKLYNEYFK